VFARRFISNPDFALRIAQGKEIDIRSVEAKDQATWYGHPEGHKYLSSTLIANLKGTWL
jgi:2,4-dienoyl-CoA reductase-like NADH-dependent reductase (Old Yellow Enzyme family)